MMFKQFFILKTGNPLESERGIETGIFPIHSAFKEVPQEFAV